MNTESQFAEVYPVMYRDFEQFNKLPKYGCVREERGEIAPGYQNIWYEYIPSDYSAEKEYPLVVQLHGGGNDGRRWVDFTIWNQIAEKNGCIVIYPNSLSFERWGCTDEEIQYLYDLIMLMQERYSIDKSRVYMQGMSNGEVMTLAFTMRHSDILAAAGNITGPSPAEMIEESDIAPAPLPVLQMRGERDVFYWLPDPLPKDISDIRYTMNDVNREVWERVNGKDDSPWLMIRGKDNFMQFNGANAPIIHWEIKDMGHREPPEGAQVLWDMLYSGCRRVDGKSVWDTPVTRIKPDKDLFVMALGSDKVYAGGEIKKIGSSSSHQVRLIRTLAQLDSFHCAHIGEMFDTDGLYAPVEFLESALGASVEYVNPGDEADILMADGRKIHLWASSLLVETDGRYMGLKKPCILICGQFFVPVASLCEDILGLQVSENTNVVAVAGHSIQLGAYTARIMRGLLGGYKYDGD